MYIYCIGMKIRYEMVGKLWKVEEIIYLVRIGWISL